MSTSPSDQMFSRMDQSAFAVVPRDLVERVKKIRAETVWGATDDQLAERREAERELIEAAIDDIS